MKRVALAVATLLLVAYVLLRAAAQPGPATTLARAATPSSALPDLRPVLAALDRARAAAYADPVTADPDAWAARTCPCYAEDARRLRALAARGHRAARPAHHPGLRHRYASRSGGGRPARRRHDVRVRHRRRPRPYRHALARLRHDGGTRPVAGHSRPGERPVAARRGGARALRSCRVDQDRRG